MIDTTADKTAAEIRCCGILLHPTALPGPYGIGDIGQSAFAFIDFLQAAGQQLWQCLPLGPTGFGDSPYQSFSAFAGQPLLISPDGLAADQLLTSGDLAAIPNFNPEQIDYSAVLEFKMPLFKKSWQTFKMMTGTPLHAAYTAFCQEHEYWLRDYALYMVLKDIHGGKAWTEWEESFISPDPDTRQLLYRQYADEMSYYQFVQFIFYRQWAQLIEYAHTHDVRLIGDIPIFVSADSADVWAHKELFHLDSKGCPVEVSGVPPDYFSADGQLWGNPLYNWPVHKKSGYSWWISRIRHQLSLTDYLRIDHFRGFEAYWSVPYGEKTAVNGQWIKGPGAALFNAMKKQLGSNLPIFAEDLGIITPEVEKLRDKFSFPGMKVLQFAFENAAEESAFLPYKYTENCICYTGTHDNDTTQGWYQKASEASRDKVRRYMSCDGGSIHWDFIRTALSSVARYAIYPLQDVLGYGSDCRMNTPGTSMGNWTWRFLPNRLTPELADSLNSLTVLFGRHHAQPFSVSDTGTINTNETEMTTL